VRDKSTERTPRASCRDRSAALSASRFRRIRCSLGWQRSGSLAAVVNIELINTGTELMLGAVLNTHQQWIGRQLAAVGRVVGRQVAVGDSARQIQEAVREALTRADLVLVTGGLGPTADDLTREELAGLLGRPLHADPAVLARLEAFFRARGRAMPERVRRQAMVPEGAIVLPNPHGSAPGLVMEVSPNPFASSGEAAWLILLPGPPRELRPMFCDHVLPWLNTRFPPAAAFVCRTLRTTGIGESWVEAKIERPLHALIASGLEVGYCARPGQVDVRLAGHGPAAAASVAEAEQIVRAELGVFVFGEGEETLETVVVRRLTERRQTLVVAESCTGGHLADRLTNVPGASAVILGGWITYSNAAKRDCLGVAEATLAAHGAVSEAVAREMAQGARLRGGADYALSVTGIAGPGGGSPEKPVGTVFLGLAAGDGTQAERHGNAYDRQTFKEVASQQALDLLRRCLAGGGTAVK
jgi:competence/damage-inducible protein CinA-like protein